MAGIGFELRRLLKPRTFGSLLRAYGFAGVIGSGPWVLSIAGTTGIGFFAGGPLAPGVVPFLVSVTWLMAFSLILTGPLQLLFSRFVADRVYAGESASIVGNLFGAMALTTAVSGLCGFGAAGLLFPAESLLYRVALGTAFVTLCNLWLLVVLLSGLKQYGAVLGVFALGYGISLVVSLPLSRFLQGGLLASFALGQAAMLFGLLGLVLRSYQAKVLVSFEFLDPARSFYDLAAVGLFYNLGIWADKAVFWLSPQTSTPVVGPLRASLIYDLPVFLAYLSVIPGTAAFLLRVETDFAEAHGAFYASIKDGGSLDEIEGHKAALVREVRTGLFEICKVQGVTALILLAAGPALLRLLQVSALHLPLFGIDLVGVGLQVLLLAVLNVFFYFDERRIAFFLAAFFALCNGLFSFITVQCGPRYYGMGFATAVVVTTAAGLILLSRTLDQLEYDTFMLRN